MPTTQPHFTKGLVIVLLVVGASRCSTISERSEYGLRAPSSLSVEQVSQRDPAAVKDPATRAVLSYRAAVLSMNAKQNVEACESFRALALDNELKLPEPIRILTRIRTIAVCPSDRALPLAQPPTWIAEESARASLVIAKQTRDAKATAEALYEVAGFEKTQKLRVERLTESLATTDRLLKTASSDPAFTALRLKVAERLVTTAPRFALQETIAVPPAALSIAHDLRSARDFNHAREIYTSIARDESRPDLERLRALDGIRQSFKLQLRTPEFIEATTQWQAFAKKKFLIPGVKKKDPSLLRVYLETRIQYARAVWTDHRPSEAKKILLETEKQVSRRIAVHESMLIRARIAEEAGDFNEMAAILYQVPIDSLPDRATKARFLWYKGWNLRRLAMPSSAREAIAALEMAVQYEDRHSDQTRDMYWTAKLYQQVGEPEKARQLFTDLADYSPFGFYGITAQRELGLPFPSLKSTGPDYSPSQRSPIPDSIRVPVDWFVILGEHEIGRRFIESFPTKEVWDASHSLDRKEATLVMLSRLEQHITVSSRVDELSPDDRKRLLLKRPELIFPLPFEARILEESSRQSIPPALIYSIMRQESLFNTFARSPADAFGLMQLIPEMATVAAKELGVDFHGAEDLYNPDKNIALGSAFLKKLFKKYDDRFILAVSAYNANDRAIQGWLRTRMRPDPLEFIEEIPYDETRLYVKLVMRNYVTYMRRMSNVPVSFPESLLRLQTTTISSSPNGGPVSN